MRISDWSSDVCSSDLAGKAAAGDPHDLAAQERLEVHAGTEVPAGTGDDADTDIAIVLDLFACARQAFGDRAVDGVARIGPVDRDDRDRRFDLQRDRKSTRLDSSH